MREIEIRLPCCILVLTEGELMQMLREHVGIWQQGLQRGKGLQRSRQAERRTERGTHSDYR